MVKTSKSMIASVALASLAVAGCSSEPGTPGKTSEEQIDVTLADAIAEVDELETVASALSRSGLAGVFDGQGTYTLLAPDDAAFEKLGEQADSLREEEQRAILIAILRNHMVPGHLTPEAISDATKAAGGTVEMRSLGVEPITFSQEGDRLLVSTGSGDTAQISGSAVATSNGVIIPIDTVLALPETGA